MGDPWLQREGETDKAYKAFCFYMEEEAKTLFDAFLDYCAWNWDGSRAEAERKKRSDKKPARWFERWPSEHDWSDRRSAFYAQAHQRAFDRLMESKLQRKVERVEMLDRVREQLEEVIPYLAALALKEGSEMSPKDFVNALDKVMRNYREELDDMPTERKEHTVKEANQMLDQILGIGDVTTSPQEQQSE